MIRSHFDGIVNWALSAFACEQPARREGDELKVVELSHADTSHPTALYVPSIGLTISADGVYNNTHLISRSATNR
jgi:hypothetical protein